MKINETTGLEKFNLNRKNVSLGSFSFSFFPIQILFKYFMIFSLFAAVSFAAVAGCSLKDKSTKTSSMKQEKTTEMIDSMTNTNNSKLETAVLGAGCFWCVEAIFQDLKGVERVESGYSGGNTKNPTYKEVCSGTTGHAEVVKITFDPTIISYEQVLTVFFHVHDPTTLNRQGADAGTQYRSAIFYNNDDQKKTAEKVKEEITNQKLWDDPIVTEITPAGDYYSAEDYHQNYFNDNPNASYCSYVIAPKVKKFYKEFGHLLKEGAGK